MALDTKEAEQGWLHITDDTLPFATALPGAIKMLRLLKIKEALP